MDVALARGTVADQHCGHAVLAPQPGGEGQPVGHGRHRPQVADHADHVVVEGPEVERAVAPAGVAAGPAEELAEQHREVEAAAGEHGEVAMHRQQPVVGLRSAATRPTDTASCPMPENHFDNWPRRSRFSIRSSIARGRTSARNSAGVVGREGALVRGDGHVVHSPRSWRTDFSTSGRSVMIPSTPRSSSSCISSGSSIVQTWTWRPAAWAAVDEAPVGERPGP